MKSKHLPTYYTSKKERRKERKKLNKEKENINRGLHHSEKNVWKQLATKKRRRKSNKKNT